MPIIAIEKPPYQFIEKSTGVACFFALSILPSGFALSPNPMEVGLEWVDTNDISLLQGSWFGDFNTGTWESTVSLAYGRYSMDYVPVPFDFRGRESHLSERNIALQFNTQDQITRNLAWMGGFGVYDGFTNYRSVWLDEYYRQQFSDLPDVPGAENYVDADPKGLNVTAGARWEYKPATGFAQINVSWLEDDVSPGYEIDFDGLRRSEIHLHTGAVSLSTENILSKRVRTYAALRASETTEREPRYGADFSVHIAMGEHWISRWSIGGALEDPQFEAIYGGIALEHSLNDKLSWYVDARYYEDTGEIENALLFTSAAPGLVSERYGIGLRLIGDKWSSRFYFAPLQTDYQPTNENIDFFQNLYSDRNWNIFQVAVSRTL